MWGISISIAFFLKGNRCVQGNSITLYKSGMNFFIINFLIVIYFFITYPLLFKGLEESKTFFFQMNGLDVILEKSIK